MKMNEKRLSNMKEKSLPKMADNCKRVRTSNGALVTRLWMLSELFEDCSVRMKQLREQMEIVCQQHKITQYKLIPKRRKYIFQKMSDDETNKNDTTTITARTNTNTNTSNMSENPVPSTTGGNDTDNNDDDDDTTAIPTPSPLFKFQRNMDKYDKPNTNNPLLTELLRFDK
jgi:hypothetical protein